MNFLNLDERLSDALAEDLGRGDITTDAVIRSVGVKPARATAQVLAKEGLVLAGWPILVRVFRLLGPVEDEVAFKEGECVGKDQTIGYVRGEPATLLKGERVGLNILQRMCGIATETREFVGRISHTRTKILDTRKTTPLWRDLEKYAVRCGGGYSHRQGLDDGILIKENHSAVAGGIANAIHACREAGSHLHRIEVEVRDLDELREALAARADIVLLDNMSVDQVKAAVGIVNGQARIEVSGGIRQDNVAGYAEAGVDFISLGALTHSYRARDISILLDM
ncbi:MAG: carboxylating nicotinate-nucleotide diphosphorylase [Acidobacteria bacterium]|nr:MAG: carboxylating nicotinate-nucleotide diphosphorylase [Acidobacteriota bacterium]